LARDRALDATQRRCLQPLRIIARLYLALLTDVHQAGYPVFAHRLGLGPWRKVWIAQMARWR
jgi:phytoene/squalene synthetase